jgi:hypothetical protein
MPKGRGEATASIGLYYNNKMWETRPEVMSTGYYSATQNPIPRVYTRTKLARSQEGGWRYGLQYSLQLLDRGPLSLGWLGVSEIELPTQAGSQKYLFSYNNTGSGLWGQLTAATLPTGARADYQYRIDGYGTTPPVNSGTSDTGYSRVLNDAPKQNLPPSETPPEAWP